MTINDEWLTDRVNEIKASILFLTRLPLAPARPLTGADLARATWSFPLAGLLVGIVAAVVYALARRLEIPPWPAALLTLAATFLVTGCLHEDGLADTADGFGGGATRQRKLDIMRDSRIGTYGVCAVVLSILLRASVLATPADPALVIPALIAAHSAARAAIPVFMFLLPPARGDGLSFDIGVPVRAAVMTAGLLGIVILVICLGLGLGIGALILVLIAMAVMWWLSVAQVGGQTGDVLGALEQLSEIVVLLIALR